MKRILIVGATSAIAEQVGRHIAVDQGSLYLAARDFDRLKVIAKDFLMRGAIKVEIGQLDLTDAHTVNSVLVRASELLSGLDCCILAAGTLHDQMSVNNDSDKLREALEVNAISAMVILNAAGAFFEQQGHGQVVAIGSVAGDRGRASNYAYGAAKGALEIFISGLRQRLHRRGVQVLLVKPGFVDTPMTANFHKGPLWATLERVAKDIVRAMEKGHSVIYTPWFWRWIMLIIRLIPERLFLRLRF